MRLLQLELVVAAVAAGVLIFRRHRSWFIKGAATTTSWIIKKSIATTFSEPLLTRRPTRLLRSLPVEAVPARLSCAFYFDLEAASNRGESHGEPHDLGAAQLAEYLRRVHDVGAALDGLHEYVVATLCSLTESDQHRSIMVADGRALDTGNGPVCLGDVSVSLGEGDLFMADRLIGGTRVLSDHRTQHRITCNGGCRIEGGTFDVSNGDIWIGHGTSVQAGALICGPAIIGSNCAIRHNAFIRGDVAIGHGSVIGCEIKHALTLDEAELPHHGYVGDSLLGHKAHFGAGACTANFPLFANRAPAVEIEGIRYDLGRSKFGAVLGDGAQLGCQSVTEPGTLLGANTHCYPLSRLRGLYGPDALVKNRGVEVVPLVERDSSGCAARTTGVL